MKGALSGGAPQFEDKGGNLLDLSGTREKSDSHTQGPTRAELKDLGQQVGMLSHKTWVKEQVPGDPALREGQEPGKEGPYLH